LECHDIRNMGNLGKGEKALELSQLVWPCSITFMGVLNAFANVVVLEGGRYVHSLVDHSKWL
jgi:hypothetical protein